MVKEYKYVVQRRFQTDLMKKVGGALGRMFEYIDGDSLHVNETISVIVAPKPIPKKKIEELCKELLGVAQREKDDTTISFEVVPYEESIEARARD